MIEQFNVQHKLIPTTEFKSTFEMVSAFSESLRLLSFDIKKAQRFTSSPIEFGESLNSLCTTFFSKRQKKSHLITLDLPVSNGIIMYPFGKIDYHSKEL
jgi:hypothetical protein